MVASSNADLSTVQGSLYTHRKERREMFTNSYTMTDHTYDLFQQVIDAAKEGRYCHGNGAIWCIVEKQLNGSLRDVVINTSQMGYNNQLGIKKYVDSANPVAPYVANTVVNNLEAFLDRQTGSVASYSYSGGEYAFTRIRAELLREAIKAGKEGRCLHFNGGQVYFKRENGYIRVVDFSLRSRVEVADFGALATRNYLQFGYDAAAVRSANKYWAEKASSWYSQCGMLVNA